jgi:hypothetical protein
MRKSLIIYSLLLPLLLASSVRIGASMGESSSSSPWTNPMATASEISDEDNGVSIGNLFIAAPRFDSVASCIVTILGLAHWTERHGELFLQPPWFLLNHTFLI